MSDTGKPLKIAVWGKGHYGDNLFVHLRDFWADRYTVTAVFSNVEKAVGKPYHDSGLVVSGFADAESMFREGVFEAAVMGYFGKEVFEQESKRLERLGIPVITLGSIDDVCEPEELGGTLHSVQEGPLSGERLYEFNNIHGAVSLAEDNCHSLIYFFDGSGKIANVNWNITDFTWDPSSLNYPIPLDSLPENVEYCPGDYFVASRIWGYNYGHFTFQLASQVAAMEEAGFQGRYIMPKPGFAPELLQLMGVEADRMLWLDDYPSGTVFQFERLVAIYQDSLTANFAFAGMALLADAVERHFVDIPCEQGYPSRLFVKRIGTRKLKGVASLLERYGFETMIPEEHSLTEQIAYYRAADVVVAPHGANAANAIYMHPGSSFIETFGRSWVFPLWHGTFLRRGISYQPVIQTPITENVIIDQVSDYWVDKVLLELAIQNALKLAGVADE